MDKTKRFGVRRGGVPAMGARRLRGIALAAAVACTFPDRRAMAADAYWDIDGSTAGATGGTTASGTWNSSNAFWSTDSTGSGATNTWVPGDFAIFSAGNDATGNSTITVSGTQLISGIRFEDGSVVQVSSGTLSLATDATFDVASNGGRSILSVISGSFGVIKTGSFAVSLGGNNSYTGNTTVNAGTLEVSADSNLGSGGSLVLNGGSLWVHNDIATSRAVTLGTSNGTLVIDTNRTYTLNGAVGGSGGLTLNGFDNTSVLVLGGTNSFAGNITLLQGVLRAASQNNLGNGSTLVFNNGTLNTTSSFTLSKAISAPNEGFNASFSPNTSTTLSVTGVVSGTGGLAKSGAGTLVLTGTNTYSGGSTINTGVVEASNASAFGSGAISLGDTSGSAAATVGFGTSSGLSASNAITVRSGSSGTSTVSSSNGSGTTNTFSGNVTLQKGVTLHSANTGGILAFSGIIGDGAGSFGVTKTGSGIVTLAGANTYDGGTTINGGVLRVFADNNLGNSGGSITFDNGAQLDISSPFTTSRSIVINSGGGTLGPDTGTTTFNGDISGGGTLFTQDSGALRFNGNNTFTGGLDIGNTSTVVVSSNANLGDSSGGVTIRAGTLFTVGDFSTARAFTLTTSSSQWNVFSGTGVSASGVISGTGALNKLGAGTLVLSGGNTYSGGTTISAGTLQVFADGSLGGSGLGVTLDGGTLATAGNFTTTRVFTMGAGGGTFAPTSPTSLTVNSALAANANGLTKAGTGDLILTTSSARTGATAITSGGLRVNEGSALGSGGITVNGTGALRLAGVSVGQNLTLAGNGTIHGFSSTSTYAGTVSVDAGATPTLNSGTVNTLVIGDGANDYTGGSGATTSIIGTGDVILPFPNDYQGNWSISGGGTLQIPADNALGSGGGTISFNTGTLAVTASTSSARSITLSAGGGALSTSSSTSLTWSGVVGGAGGLTKTGDGILVLNGANTYTGGTTVNAGTLLLNSGSPIGSGALTLADTTVVKGNNGGSTITLANAVSLTSGTAEINIPFGGGTDLILNGVISGSGALRVTADGNGRWLWLNGANSFSGGITLDGTSNARPGIRIGHSAALGTGTFTSMITAADSGNRAGRLTIEAADLDIANAMVIGSGARLTVNTDGAADVYNTTFSGAISGAGTLQKLGTGVLTLTADSTFVGGITISAGTLRIGAGGTSGSVLSDITNTGTLTFARSE